jgi:Protein of unknown function (DUF3225)
MTINDPEVAAELRALYLEYEQALVTNDVEKLVAMFWDAQQVMRFGANENLYGPEELAVFRKSRPPSNLARTVKRVYIVSFGRDLASITLEFERLTGSGAISGRQSQVWVRFEQGWRIAQAHVSVLSALNPVLQLG